MLRINCLYLWTKRYTRKYIKGGISMENELMNSNMKVQTISSREVAEMMEVEHKNLLQKIDGINKILVAENSATKYWTESTFENRGKQYREFQVTKRGCEFLAHKSTGEKGIIFTDRYMDRFEEMENALKEQQPRLPQTYKEALQQLIIEIEEKEKLEEQNKLMQPKAQYFDNLVDRNLLTNFRDTAKELHIKQNVFINWLLENGYIYRDSKKKLKPYAQHIDSGLFELREYSTEKNSGVQTLITPKGRETFKLLFK